MPSIENKQSAAHGEPGAGQSPLLSLVFDLVPIAWLALVLAAYALVVLVAPPRPTAEVPGLADLERAVLPLLAFLGLIAIIRYFSLRKRSHTQAARASEGSPEGRETP